MTVRAAMPVCGRVLRFPWKNTIFSNLALFGVLTRAREPRAPPCVLTRTVFTEPCWKALRSEAK